MAINRGSSNHTVADFLFSRIFDLDKFVLVVPCLPSAISPGRYSPKWGRMSKYPQLDQQYFVTVV